MNTKFIIYRNTIRMYSCVSCSKTFTNKGSLNNHKSLCELLTLTTREKKIKSEELDAMPCHEDLVRITQRLASKYVELEKSLEKMEKLTSNYTKCKINGDQWLNQHIKPTYDYNELIKRFKVDSDDISMLFEKKIVEIFSILIERHVRKTDAPVAMINGKMFVFKECEENKLLWMSMERKEIVCIMNTILQRIMEVMTKWRCENADRIAKNDTLSIEYNKVLIKLMNTNFNQDSMFGKLKTQLGSIVRFDVVNTIEYVVV